MSSAHTTTGNIFADLGLANPDEELAKAKLAFEVSQLLSKRKIPQKDMARILGISQPEVSNLKRGYYHRFSRERLMDILTRLGKDVEIRVRDHRGPEAVGVLTVLTRQDQRDSSQALKVRNVSRLIHDRRKMGSAL